MYPFFVKRQNERCINCRYGGHTEGLLPTEGLIAVGICEKRPGKAVIGRVGVLFGKKCEKKVDKVLLKKAVVLRENIIERKYGNFKRLLQMAVT